MQMTPKQHWRCIGYAIAAELIVSVVLLTLAFNLNNEHSTLSHILGMFWWLIAGAPAVAAYKYAERN